MIFYFVLLSTISLIVYANETGSSQRKWSCIENDLCVLDNVNDNEETQFESQNICRLSCGRYGALWPRPTLECVLSHDRTLFEPRNVRFHSEVRSNTTAQYLSEINRIFIKNIVKECLHNCSVSTSAEVLVKLTVNATNLNHDWDTDESYSLTTRLSGSTVLVDIKSRTVYGARNGLETLSQLITGNVGNGLVIVSSARIQDRPMYKHRGVMLDTARNYIPVKNIKMTLDGLAASKLNVLHWHATDSHSFPIEIKSVPELQTFGAYSSQQVYSQRDMQQIVKYARLRGIRVIIELDGPSHSGNGWQWGPHYEMGDLAVCINKQPWRKYCIQPPCGQLNPVNDNVYHILNKIFEDIADIIPKEETIHMGGDEVFLPCWNSTKEIVDVLAKNNLKPTMENFMRLWAQFHGQNIEQWQKIKREKLQKHSSNIPVILWSSHLTEPDVIEQFLPKEKYIIQTWVASSSSLNTDLINKGYRIISSTKDAWYLDHGFWGSTRYYGWKDVYNNRLSQNNAVLGGEVCMWTEYVDENSLDSRIWPRAGAAAERLWADPQTDAVQAETRFYRYRERLISRGIKPDAVTPKWCTLHEGECY